MAQGRYTCTAESAQLRNTAVYGKHEKELAKQNFKKISNKIELFVDFKAKSERKRLRRIVADGLYTAKWRKKILTLAKFVKERATYAC
jgi:hypothetical protein